MAKTVLELPDGDIAGLLPHVDGAEYINIFPGAEGQPERTAGPLRNLFGSRGPSVPLATWTPGEIGLQHPAGPGVVAFLAERGVPVPDEWYVVTQNPKRGLVLRTYQSPPADTLAWLVRAATATCPVEITEPWRAVISTR